MRGRARGENVRLRGSKEFFVKGESPFVRRSHEGLERKRERGGYEGLGWRKEALSCRILGKVENGEKLCGR